jgi:arylformamidase
MVDFRAELDAEVTFLNGGALQAQGFRLDVPGPDVGEQELGVLFVEHLGLLMVDQVRLSSVRIFEEQHKGSRGVAAGGTPDSRTRLVELSHVVRAGMTTYPGLPGPVIDQHLTREASRAHYAPGTEFAIDRITMVGNTGTYLDSPYHRYADGTDLAGLALESLADLPATVVRLTGSTRRSLDVAALAAVEVTGMAVLLHTGWDRHWGTGSYGVEAPYLSADAARWLADRGAALVGIDSVNIDDVDAGDRPAHSTLLGAGIPVVEHLTALDQLPATGARFTAAPPRVASFGTVPVRAFAAVPASGDSPHEGGRTR